MALMAGCYLCSIFLCLSPLMSSDNLALPYRNIWIPLNFESKIYYRFTYLYHALCLLSTTVITFACDTYLYQFMEKICAELDVFKHRLHIIPKQINENFKLKGNQYELTSIKDWLHFHLHILQ